MKIGQPKWKFTEREKVWIREYCRSIGNASRAAKIAYGGTPLSCRVKGWRKRNKFEAILKDMFNRGLFMVQGGVDAYLAYLETGDNQLLQVLERRQRQIESEDSDLWPYPVRKSKLEEIEDYDEMERIERSPSVDKR